jgi:hypothetical protein
MPWRTRAQNARTRCDSSAKPTSTPIPIAVSTKSRKRGCDAKNCRSNAGIFEKSGGLGNTPCVKAKARMKIAMKRSNTASTKNAAATAGYVEFGTEDLTRKSLMTSPPRAGTTLLKPYAAM